MRRALWTIAALCVLSGCDRDEASPLPPPPALGATIVAPEATNAALVTVRVDVTGDPDKVELAVDGIVVGELLPPYAFVWRTGGLPDGMYYFGARVHRGGEEALGAPVTVRLDRVGPTLEITAPSPGTLLSPPWPDVTFTLDERIDRASFHPGDVTITSASFTGSVPAIVTLDPGERTVRVHPTHWGSAPIQVCLADVADLAGNALVAPVCATYPNTPARVLSSGTASLSRPQVAADERGRIVVAFVRTEEGETPELVVIRAPGDLASPVERLEGTQPRILAYDAAVTIDPTGAPVLAAAWIDGITLWRWNDVRWEALGPATPDDRHSTSPALAFDGLGRVVLAWEAMTQPPEPPLLSPRYVVRAARLAAGAWEDLGEVHDPALHGSWPSLALASDGTPLVSYWNPQDTTSATVVKGWNGAAWEVFGDSGLWGIPRSGRTGRSSSSP
jgi:hypothetical protein